MLHRGAPQPQLDVLIAGGGVAALETALALRDLAGDLVAIRMVAPTPEFTYWPVGVLSPFKERPPRRLQLKTFAAEVGATFEEDAVVEVDSEQRIARTLLGRDLLYDALVIAPGAKVSELLPGAIAVNPARMEESLRVLLEEIDSGSLSTLGFVAPKPTWPLPVYELALLAAERIRARERNIEVTIVTAEARPLAAFGEPISTGVSELLAQAGINLRVGGEVEASSAGLRIRPGDEPLELDRVVALPRLAGPALPGLVLDEDGFLPINSRCEVIGSDRVYAAGDATRFPVKFGGIAAQQAYTAATAIAALAGAAVEPEEFRGDVHGVLVADAGERRMYFAARIVNGVATESRVSATPTWSPDAKIAARYLAPYLDGLWAEGPRWIAGQLAWEETLRRLESHVAG
jgi:sulfide:quinone oxidoreductase